MDDGRRTTRAGDRGCVAGDLRGRACRCDCRREVAARPSFRVKHSQERWAWTQVGWLAVQAGEACAERKDRRYGAWRSALLRLAGPSAALRRAQCPTMAC